MTKELTEKEGHEIITQMKDLMRAENWTAMDLIMETIEPLTDEATYYARITFPCRSKLKEWKRLADGIIWYTI